MSLKMETAINLANIEAGAGRNVMILVPDVSWVCGAWPRMFASSASRGTIYIRCTTNHSGLKTIAVDTLILVEPNIATWDAAGEAYARERLRTSTDPRVIKVG